MMRTGRLNSFSLGIICVRDRTVKLWRLEMVDAQSIPIPSRKDRKRAEIVAIAGEI